MVRLPPGCDFDRSELDMDDGRICRTFNDENGKEIHRVYASVEKERVRKPYQLSKIKVKQGQDSKSYQREYYRRVRRARSLRE